MNRRKAISALSLASLAAAQPKPVRNNFIGVWKLVSSESTDKSSGEVRYPYGSNPVGRLTYDATGRMSVQMMNPGRRVVGGSPTRGRATAVQTASPDDMRDILTGFSSYFGTFEIDESSRTVIHHVQAHLLPSWVGTDLRRNYEFTSINRLILTAPSDQGTTRLVWQRDAA